MSMAESRDFTGPEQWGASDGSFERPENGAQRDGGFPFGTANPFTENPQMGDPQAGSQAGGLSRATTSGSLEARDILTRAPRQEGFSQTHGQNHGPTSSPLAHDRETEMQQQILNDGLPEGGFGRREEFTQPLRENALALSESRALPLADPHMPQDQDDPYQEDFAGLEGAPILEALEDAQESIASVIRVAVTELKDISTHRAKLERRLGESERIRLELQRQLEASDMVLRRSEERLAEAERESQQRTAEMQEFRHRTAQAEARAATADRIIEDADATTRAKLEDAESRIEALSKNLREEARRTLEASEQDANLRVEAARAEAERQLEAARTGAEARAEFAEAEASRFRERIEAAERTAEEASQMMQQLQADFDRVKEENLKLKAWRAKATEKLKSLGLIK